MRMSPVNDEEPKLPKLLIFKGFQAGLVNMVFHGYLPNTKILATLFVTERKMLLKEGVAKMARTVTGRNATQIDK